MGCKAILLNVLVITVLVILTIILAVLYALSFQTAKQTSSTTTAITTTTMAITTTTATMATTTSNLNLKYYNIFKSNSNPKYTISSYNGTTFSHITSVVARKYAGITYYFIVDVGRGKLIKMTIQPDIAVKVVSPAWIPWHMDASDSFLFIASNYLSNNCIMKYDLDLNHIMTKNCTLITGFYCLFVQSVFDSMDNLIYSAIAESRILKMTTDFQLIEFLTEVKSSDIYVVMRMNNGVLYANTQNLIRVFKNNSCITTYSVDMLSPNLHGIEIDPNGFLIYTDPDVGTVKLSTLNVKLSTLNETFTLKPESAITTTKFDYEGRLMVCGLHNLYFYY